MGRADHPEQEAFVAELIRTLGVSTIAPDYPAYWRFRSEADVVRVLVALRARLKLIEEQGQRLIENPFGAKTGDG
jgi:acetyl esterase/lipase